MTEPAIADLAALPTLVAGPSRRAHRRTRPIAPIAPRDDPTWWRNAVIYEVYVRSFADANGDGTGDLAGVRSRLPYLRDLGVDAIWFTPWYVSPLADGGYDVADYRAIDPAFGTLAEAEALIAEALAARDPDDRRHRPQPRLGPAPVVPGGARRRPGSPERDALLVPPGSGAGRRPAADRHWPSNFGRADLDAHDRSRWRAGRVVPAPVHGRAAGPQLGPPRRPREHEDILRFWFDRGVAGVRIDSAALLVKDPTLPEVPDDPGPGDHPIEDRDELHEIYRSWRAVADSYPGTRVLVGEVWLPDIERFARYLRPDELHTAFNFDFMARPWDAASLRDSIDATLAAHAPVGAPATWVLSNHDVTRPVTRYGREDSSFAFARKRHGAPTDLELGRRRARAAALLSAALPGSLYIYQGDELGLDEVDVPLDEIQDPMHARSGGDRPRPRRLPRAAAVGWRRARRSGSARRTRPRPMAQPAGPLGRADRRAAGIRSRLDAQPVPDGAAHPAHRAGPRGRAADMVAVRAGRPRLRARRRASSTSRTCPAPRSRCRPTGRSCWRARDVSDGHLPPDATAWLRPDRAEPTDPARRVPADDR